MEKGSSSSSSFAGGSALNGLQFGQKIYFEDVGSELGRGSPAKKGRYSAAQPPRCQVEGCYVDLSEAKTYYARHKVCGMHSKASSVIVAGIHQRFCQQCSRFHKLSEFDQGKRSCRRRLACHNERRRKAPPVSVSVSPMLTSTFGSLSSTPALSPNMFGKKIGGYLMDFAAFSTPAGQEPWANAARGLGNQLQLPWQTNWHNPLPSQGVSSANCFNVLEPAGALSLLSNQQPWAYRPRPLCLGMNSFLGTNANTSCTTMFQPSVSPIGQFPFLGSGQVSHQLNGQYNGELGLAQPNNGRFDEPDQSRGYDSFV